ncbi:MAG: InlB B-repeat-containing protein [Firmicutes bacterium]|nr:InlB B-repeat-containing protein [Bacillota bacterium]
MTKKLKKSMFVLVCALVFAFGLCVVGGDGAVLADALGAVVTFEKGEGPKEDTITGMPEIPEGQTAINWTVGEQVLPEAPKTTDSNFEFMYWKTTETAADGTEKEATYKAGDKYAITADKVGATITFTAVWGVKVSFDTNLDESENVTAPEAQLIEYGSDFSITQEMTTADYDFLGWATEAKKDDVTAEYKKGDIIEDVKAPLTLYGVWKAHFFSVNYYANTKDDNADSAVIVPVDSTKYMGDNLTATIMGKGDLASTNKNFATMKDAKVTRTGYTFMGWATTADATTAEYQPGQTITMDKDLTLYAVWKQGAAATESTTKSTTSTTPQTGDSDQLSLYLIMAALSLLGIAYLCYDQKKVKGTR